jgi:CBS domain-containing protein
MGVRELPVIDGDSKLVGLISEAAIAHEYMRARVSARMEAAAPPTEEVDSDDQV